MKRKVNPGIALFLALIMVFGIFPVTGLAANDEMVLTSINHSSAVAAVDVTGKNSATLTVPYAYSGTVDFSNGLDISYDTSVYTSASAGFPSGSAATVGGNPVLMTVTYQKKDDATLYLAQYSINVIRASGTVPSFVGTISKSVTLPGSLTFATTDFTSKYTKNDGESLASIAITGSNPTFGALKLGSGNYTLGEAVSVADLTSGRFAFLATSVGTVSYLVKAYASGDTDTLIGSVILTITVHANTDAGTVTYETDKSTPITLNSAGFTNAFSAATGETLSYVKFTLPSSAYGKLYYNYTSPTDYDSLVSATTKYYRNTLPDISHVTFVPYSDYAGTVTIFYTGYGTDGNSFTGEIKIAVEDKAVGGSKYFTDIGKNLSWASDAIDYLYEQGIVTGSENGHFNPNASIKRGDFILMLCKAFDLKADTKGNFSDVSEGSYYYNAIAVSKMLGISKGAHGKFNPNSALSREDAMVLILRALDAADITIAAGSEDDLAIYTDNQKVSHYAKGAVCTFTKAHIIKGNGKKINPKSSISRAEIAVILYRILTM